MMGRFIRSICLIVLFAWTCQRACLASAADTVGECIGYTIITSTLISRIAKDLDDNEINIRLSNGMLFQLSGADEAQASVWGAASVAVLAKKMTIKPSKSRPQPTPITLYKVLIDDDVFSAYRIR